MDMVFHLDCDHVFLCGSLLIHLLPKPDCMGRRPYSQCLLALATDAAEAWAQIAFAHQLNETINYTMKDMVIFSIKHSAGVGLKLNRAEAGRVSAGQLRPSLRLYDQVGSTVGACEIIVEGDQSLKDSHRAFTRKVQSFEGGIVDLQKVSKP